MARDKAQGSYIDSDEQSDLLQEEEVGKKRRPKKRIIFLAFLFILLLSLIVLAVFLLKDKEVDTHGEQAALDTPERAVDISYFDIPEILVNLSSLNSRNRSYLKLVITLEFPQGTDMEYVKGQLPRLLDSYQVYLRELTASDFEGSAGILALKEGLIIRSNAILGDIYVNDVLFKELLVQ